MSCFRSGWNSPNSINLASRTPNSGLVERSLARLRRATAISDPHYLPLTSLPDHEYGTTRELYQSARDASDEQAPRGSPATRPADDEIRRHGFRVAEDCVDDRVRTD